MKSTTRISSRLLLASVTLLLGGCGTISYYHQAIAGHLDLMLSKQSIDKLLSSERTNPQILAQLTKVAAIRNFAQEQLGLPAEEQYTTYVELRKPYVVWNVFAAPRFSFAGKQWCYPIVGCASYRGYYNKESALRYAARLSAQNYDVHVGGSAAYSTLGWFSDPVLSTFIHRSDAQLADLIFHELAHHLIYVAGDTLFNESFASLVAREGVTRWLTQQGTQKDTEQYLEQQARHRKFIELINTTKAKLIALYQSGQSEAAMLERKKQAIMELRAAHNQLKITWGGSSPYEGWFAKDINNAQLSSVATYYQLVPAFAMLLESHNGNLAKFYAACREMGELNLAERHAQLEKYQAQVEPSETRG